jgi:glycosyltransferase involved in cell wall biosynthesis
MAPFGDAVRFLGALDGTALQAAYSDAALLIWPGVNEAFGMVYLEAQAMGLSVVAQDRPGVRDVLAPGTYPGPEAGATGLAARLEQLLSDTKARHDAGAAAARHIARHHLRPVAARTLLDGLHRAGVAP